MKTQAQLYLDKFHSGSSYDRIMILCTQKAVDIDQDWSDEKTVFTFDDDSCLIFNGSDVYCGA